MDRIIQTLPPLYCETGASIDDGWRREMADWGVSPRPRRGTIPFQADLRWWFCEQHHAGHLREATDGVDLSKIFPDGVPSPVTRPPVPPTEGVEIEEVWTGEPIRYVNGGYPGRVHTVVVRVDGEPLTAREEYASFSFGTTEHPVKTLDDLRLVKRLFERRVASYEAGVGGRTVPVRLPMTSIQSYLIQWAGVERAVGMWMEAMDEVEGIVGEIEEMYRPVAEAVAEARAGQWVGSCENLSSDVSGTFWDRLLGPQLRRRAEILSRRDCPYQIHLDGAAMPLLSRLRDVGLRGANGLTALPSGNLDPCEFRAKAGTPFKLMDILPQSIFVPGFYGDREFETYVRRVIEFYRDDGDVRLGIGDMLPVNGSLGRVERAIDWIEEMTG